MRSSMVFFIARNVCTTNTIELARRAALFWFPGFRPAHPPRLGAPQGLHFFRTELAVLARPHIQLERAVGYALDFLNVVPDFFKHAPYLAMLALDQRDFIPR